MSFFSKEEIIERFKEKKAVLGDNIGADANLALLILSSSLFEQKRKDGSDYCLHPVHVGMANTYSRNKQIVGFLHDIVEDSEWELEDLSEIGFSKDIINAVDAMTHREGEAYFKNIERCSLNVIAMDRKIEDLVHNMGDYSVSSRFVKNKDIVNINKYKISKEYLLAVQDGVIESGGSIREFALGSELFIDNADISDILDEFGA